MCLKLSEFWLFLTHSTKGKYFKFKEVYSRIKIVAVLVFVLNEWEMVGLVKSKKIVYKELPAGVPKIITTDTTYLNVLYYPQPKTA